MNRVTPMMLAATTFAAVSCQAQVTIPDFNETQPFSALTANPHCHTNLFVDGLVTARSDVAIGGLRVQTQALSSPVSQIPLFMVIKGSGSNKERFVTDLVIWDSIPNGTGEINGILMFFDAQVNPKLDGLAQMGGTVTTTWITQGSTFVVQSIQTVNGISTNETLGSGVLSTINGTRWMVLKDVSGKPLASMIVGKSYSTTVDATAITFLREGALTDDNVLAALLRVFVFIPKRYGYGAF
jgi:hypothetical protein